MSSVEEFDARTQSARVTPASSANVAFLRAMSSKTASTTMSTSSNRAYDAVGVMRPIVCSTWAGVILPFAIVTS
jgi:hypothetical protein